MNTFQAVIASSHTESYVIFKYPQNGIQWIKGQGKDRNNADARAQVGIMSGPAAGGNGKHLLLPVSGLDQVKKLHQ